MDSQVSRGQTSSLSGSGFALTDWLQLLRLDGQEVKEQQVPGTHTRKNLKFWLCVCLKTCIHRHTHTHVNITRNNTHSEKLPYSLRESFYSYSQSICVSSVFSQPQKTTKGSEIFFFLFEKMPFCSEHQTWQRRGEKKCRQDWRPYFIKQQQQRRIQSKYCYWRRIRKVCVCGEGGRGEHNNMIDTMKTNESLKSSQSCSSLYQERGGGVWVWGDGVGLGWMRTK